MKLQRNVGKTDMTARLLVGAVLVLVGLFAVTGAWMWVLVIVGVLAIASGITRSCILYQVLGISTEKTVKVYPQEPPSNPNQPM